MDARWWGGGVEGGGGGGGENWLCDCCIYVDCAAFSYTALFYIEI